MSHTPKISRRKVLVSGAVAAVGAVLTSPVAAAIFNSGSISSASQVRDLSMPANVTLRVESLKPIEGDEAVLDVLANVPLGKVLSLEESTKISSPLYFVVDVDRRNTTPRDLNFTITLFDEEGDDVGRINIGDRGVAIFRQQQIQFHVVANFS